MKENYFFRQIKTEAEKKKEAAKVQPLTLGERQESEQEPMTLKDHWLSLRQSIQEKISTVPASPEEIKRTKLMNELITPELMAKYKEILKTLNDKTRRSEQHPQRELIDINNTELSARIAEWIDKLIAEVKTKKEIGLDETDAEELEAQCWMFFDSIAGVMNTKSIEKDIAESHKHTKADKSDLAKDLQDRYLLSKAEVKMLLELFQSDKDGKDKYSPKILVETISKLWGEYKLGERKGKITKISLGYLTSKAAESFAPSLFQNILVDNQFNVAVFLEYFGLKKVHEIIDAKTDIELTKIMNEVNHQINDRIINSLFFQEFEFIHEKSLGEIFETLERGKKATGLLLQGVIARLAPTLSGIAMSLVFLTKINPALGAIGLCSLPMMYKIAKRQNEEAWPMYDREKSEGEKIMTNIGSIKSGFEDIKTSPNTPSVAGHVREQMNAKDTLSTHRIVEEIKMRLKGMIPFDVSTIVAVGVGGALQAAGMISGGAVLSNVIYSEYLQRPIRDLVNLYFNSFSRNIQDVQRMDDILGSYEKMDLPEGEKERDRVAVSELKNFDISIKNLRYKNILRGVSLDIRQGEFLTIAGVSGAGKSTLLRNLVGLYKSDSGEIEISGVKIDRIKKYGKKSIYSIMSYCNQNPQIFDGMTLRENLLLWSQNEADDAKIEKVLKDLHLDKFLDRLDEEVKNLSGGERVRIGVARTLIKGAKIMLLDEPTASLDSQASTEVRKILSEINEKYPDTTIICVSHDEELIKSSKRSVKMGDLQK